MRLRTKIKLVLFAALSTFIFVTTQAFAAEEQSSTDNKSINPVITQQIFAKAKKNNDWKFALVTGKNAQIVFMNISPSTNPTNEVGMETHKFDQVIFIAEGNAKAVLNGKSTSVKSGDMIFIPQGTPHNIINLNAKKPLKIISVYSDTDIPVNTVYKKKSDMPQEN